MSDTDRVAVHLEVHGTVQGVGFRPYVYRMASALGLGRYSEPPDITARICGICPVAYQLSACRAIEDACGVEPGVGVEALRRMLYCGEWIESHALHIFLLHVPDFLGYPGALEMARDHRDVVERGLALKKVGNDLIDAIGGRAIHPVNVRVGGFYRAPHPRELAPFRERLLRARDIALETVRWVSTFDFPDFDVQADGDLASARIVPPTSQNQAGIEADLRRFVEQRLDLDDEELTRQCEQAIRNYDPCISCATHFLDLTVERR